MSSSRFLFVMKKFSILENDGKSDGPKMQITVPKFSTSQGGWTEFHIFIDNVFHSAVRYR